MGHRAHVTLVAAPWVGTSWGNFWEDMSCISLFVVYLNSSHLLGDADDDDDGDDELTSWHLPINYGTYHGHED